MREAYCAHVRSPSPVWCCIAFQKATYFSELADASVKKKNSKEEFPTNMQLVYLMKVQGRGKKKKKAVIILKPGKKKHTLAQVTILLRNRDHHMERPL